MNRTIKDLADKLYPDPEQLEEAVKEALRSMPAGIGWDPAWVDEITFEQNFNHIFAVWNGRRYFAGMWHSPWHPGDPSGWLMCIPPLQEVPP